MLFFYLAPITSVAVTGELVSKPASSSSWHTDYNSQPPLQWAVVTWLHLGQGNMCHLPAWPTTTFHIYPPSLFPPARWMSTQTATWKLLMRKGRPLSASAPAWLDGAEYSSLPPLWRLYGYIPMALISLPFTDICIGNWFLISSLLAFLKNLS